MQYRTDDLRIKEIKELLPPAKLLGDFPISEKAAQTVYETRQEIHRILHGADDRLVLIAGPCSIHDTKAAKEYASRLKQTKDRCAPDLLILMRVYFEKPRTTVGWKGLINDPNLDGSFRINEGLRIGARAAARNQRSRHARRQRISRHDHAAVHRRPGLLGRHRRAHHREPGAPRAGVRPLLPGRLQERHRRQRADRRGRDARARSGAASFSVGAPRAATRPSSRPPATRTATSSCAAASSRTTMRRTSMPRPRICAKPAFRRAS